MTFKGHSRSPEMSRFESVYYILLRSGQCIHHKWLRETAFDIGIGN